MGFTHHKTKRSQKIYNCERIDHAKIYSLRGFFFLHLYYKCGEIILARSAMIAYNNFDTSLLQEQKVIRYAQPIVSLKF